MILLFLHDDTWLLRGNHLEGVRFEVGELPRHDNTNYDTKKETKHTKKSAAFLRARI